MQPIGFKTFLQVLWSNLGVFSFSLKNIVLMKFGSLYKIRTIEKNTFFDSTFSVLLLLSHRNDIFWRKKKTHSNLILVLTEKIAAQKDVVRNFAEGETSTHFWPLSSLYLPEESIFEFRVYDNLCSTYLP